MNNKPYKEIAKISPEERETIRRKTAYSLPDDPSARGMRPDQVRKRFWEAIAGDKSSIFAEIDRLAAETNTALDALWMLLYGTVEIDGEAVGIADLIKTGLAQGYTLADLFEGLASGDALRLIHEKTTGKNLQQCLDDLGRLDLTAKVAPISGGHRVTLTDKNGERYFDVMDGEKGDIGLTGPQGVQGPRGVQGVQGPQGPQGKPFSIAKVYQSINAMHAGYATDGVEIGGFVVIETGNVDDADNARLYLKGNYAYEYVTDLSGMQGMQGPQGPQGLQGVQGKQGPIGPVGPAGPAGIHIGPEAPTEGQVAWIDTNEEPSAEEGGVNFDVVAKPGQVIAVKAVDVEGKPKEYKAVDLPVHDAPDMAANEGEAGHVKNRTHYVDEKDVVHKLPNKFIDADWMATKKDGGAGKTVIIPEQTVTNTWGNLKADLVEGDTYAVEVNGVLYKCKCMNDGDGTLYLGNGTLLGATEGNSEPFAIAWLTGTGGTFYSDGTLDTPIGIKVSDWVDDAYNTLPKEYLPEISWNELTDKPFIEGAGEPFFTHTATFASDAAAKNGVLVAGASVTVMFDTVYWLEVNGELLKCHWKSEFFNTVLYDEDGNDWVSRSANGFNPDGTANMAVYVSAKTAGTYTFTLYAPTDELMLDPQRLPPNLAKKSDIPTGGSGGGSASIDVTAQVGQTIIVKEVDASGKPTEWEAAEYPEGTKVYSEFELESKTYAEIMEEFKKHPILLSASIDDWSANINVTLSGYALCGLGFSRRTGEVLVIYDYGTFDPNEKPKIEIARYYLPLLYAGNPQLKEGFVYFNGTSWYTRAIEKGQPAIATFPAEYLVDGATIPVGYEAFLSLYAAFNEFPQIVILTELDGKSITLPSLYVSVDMETYTTTVRCFSPTGGEIITITFVLNM